MQLELLNEIEGIKRKILNEIEMLRYHKELNYLCGYLENELNNFKCDSYEDKDLKKYKAELEVFLEIVIGRVNSLIINSKNNSVFDNIQEDKRNKIKELEDIIEDRINYLVTNIPFLGENISVLFNNYKSEYQEGYNHALECAKKRLNTDLGMKNEQILSLYSDTDNLAKSYINKLEVFKSLYIDPLQSLIDNDKKVKDIFKRAYDTLTDETSLNIVKQLEQNYLNAVNECIDKKSSIYLIAVQERMIQDGVKLDSIVDTEEERKRYEDKIRYFSFNKSNDELLDIEQYVNRTGHFKEEFYQLAYAFIEKEKYMLNKFNVSIELYDKLSENTKANIERLFLERIKDADDSYEIVQHLREYGYLKVLDVNYQNFFDSCEFNVKSSYRLENVEADEPLKVELITSPIIVDRYELSVNSTGKKLGTYFYSTDAILINLGDIIKFDYKKYKSGGMERFIEYYDREGKRLKAPKDLDIIDRVFDFYITGQDKDKEVYDLEFNKVFRFKDKDYSGLHMFVDYVGKKIILFSENYGTVYLYDDKFNLLLESSASKLIKEYYSYKWDCLYINEHAFNDGIFTFYFRDKSDNNYYVYYYDFNNMKVLDNFTIKTNNEIKSQFMYSDGCYPFVDKDGYQIGYKDKEGNVIIEPKYYRVGPFINGVACIHNFDNYLINRSGAEVKTGDYEKSTSYYYSYEPSSKDGCYYQYDDKEKKKNRIINKDYYYMNNGYVSILSIDFDNPERVNKKCI